MEGTTFAAQTGFSNYLLVIVDEKRKTGTAPEIAQVRHSALLPKQEVKTAIRAVPRPAHYLTSGVDRCGKSVWIAGRGEFVSLPVSPNGGRELQDLRGDARRIFSGSLRLTDYLATSVGLKASAVIPTQRRESCHYAISPNEPKTYDGIATKSFAQRIWSGGLRKTCNNAGLVNCESEAVGTSQGAEVCHHTLLP